MKFMYLVKGDKDYEAGVPPTPEMIAAMGQLIEKNAKKGIFLDGAGLQPTSKGYKIKVANGKMKVVDGPFSEAKELVGGYAVLRLRSKEEAIEFGREFMQVHIDVLGPQYQGEVEIRPFEEEPEDGKQ
jgi:hypothetical protein